LEGFGRLFAGKLEAEGLACELANLLFSHGFIWPPSALQFFF
jgi:hypothetical protein